MDILKNIELVWDFAKTESIVDFSSRSILLLIFVFFKLHYNKINDLEKEKLCKIGAIFTLSLIFFQIFGVWRDASKSLSFSCPITVLTENLHSKKDIDFCKKYDSLISK